MAVNSAGYIECESILQRVKKARLVEINDALADLFERLEHDRSLLEAGQLRERVRALDELEAYVSDEARVGVALQQRARDICGQLEAVNRTLYDSIRRSIQLGEGRGELLEWMPDWSGAGELTNRRGYDYLDDLISGVLRLEEPSKEVARLESEMVAYQPTPARHIFDFTRRAGLTERDWLIDLGSGLGHVALVASICTGARCSGIELEPSYIECARKCAQSLKLNNVTFVQGDARAADLSSGTAFYLYTPFTGGVLRDVLNSLRREASQREIRIGTFGPCTRIVAEENWLSAVGVVEPERTAIFRSRD